MHLLDEIAQHLLCDFEVRDDSVLQRPDGSDVRRGPADHPLGLGPDRQDGRGGRVDGDDGGLVQDDPTPTHIYERVRSTEVDGHVSPEKAGEAFRFGGRLGRNTL
jgi:hypothetical protein